MTASFEIKNMKYTAKVENGTDQGIYFFPPTALTDNPLYHLNENPAHTFEVISPPLAPQVIPLFSTCIKPPAVYAVFTKLAHITLV